MVQQQISCESLHGSEYKLGEMLGLFWNKFLISSQILLISPPSSVFQDFFVQHCHCGAAGLAFQELKRHSRSDYHSLAVSSSALYDLTTIPEGTRIPHRPAVRGQCDKTANPVHQFDLFYYKRRFS